MTQSTMRKSREISAFEPTPPSWENGKSLAGECVHSEKSFGNEVNFVGPSDASAGHFGSNLISSASFNGSQDPDFEIRMDESHTCASNEERDMVVRKICFDSPVVSSNGSGSSKISGHSSDRSFRFGLTQKTRSNSSSSSSIANGNKEGQNGFKNYLSHTDIMDIRRE